jgi:hypothetical protein
MQYNIGEETIKEPSFGNIKDSTTDESKTHSKYPQKNYLKDHLSISTVVTTFYWVHYDSTTKRPLKHFYRHDS